MQYIPVIVFAIILIIIAFFLKRGKGLWLLSGFNTMSVEERNVYDMEKIILLVLAKASSSSGLE